MNKVLLYIESFFFLVKKPYIDLPKAFVASKLNRILIIIAINTLSQKNERLARSFNPLSVHFFKQFSYTVSYTL